MIETLYETPSDQPQDRTGSSTGPQSGPYEIVWTEDEIRNMPREEIRCLSQNVFWIGALPGFELILGRTASIPARAIALRVLEIEENAA